MDTFLGKLKARLGELDVRILVNELFMQVVEGFIFLLDYPRLIVEIYLDNILSIVSVVFWIFLNKCLLYTDAHWYLEKVRPTEPMIFTAVFDMIYKDLRRKENRAEFTLHSLRVLKNSLKDLNFRYSLLKLNALTLHFSNCFRKHFISLHNLRIFIHAILAFIINGRQ